MKLKKIVAGIAAAAVALSAMAVNAFAATFEGTSKITDTAWWTEDSIVDVANGVGVENLIGNLDPSTVKSITFKGDTAFFLGYAGTDGEWHQNTDAVSEMTVTDVLFTVQGETNPTLKIMISKGDGVEYTITWTAEGEEGAAPAETTAAETEAEPEATEAEPEAAEAEDEDIDVGVDEDEEIDIDVDDDEDVDVDDEVAAPETEAVAETTVTMAAAEAATAAPATGNVAVASIAAVMAVAGAAALVSKKRK